MNLRTGRWAKLLALLFSMALLAAACGGNADDDDEADAGDEASEPADGGGGGEPSEGPGFDGTTIRLGVVTPQTGVAAVIGNPLTAGNQLYWERVNEEGGIAGKYQVELEVVDSQYQPQTGVQQYNAVKNDVVAFQQILGTNVLNAILPLLKRDNIVASPATLDSFWVNEAQLLSLGAPYQIQAINGIDWYLNQEGNDDATVCIMRQNDPYGEAGLEGLEFASEEMGFEIAETVTFAPTDTDFGAPVNRLKGAGCTVVLLVGLPNSTGGIMGTAEQIGFTPKWLGISPTWLSLLAGNAYMQQHFTLIAEGPEFGDESSEGMAQLLADMEQFDPEAKPDLYYIFGYAQAWSMAQVLEKAVEDGDLSREGIAAAMESVGTITTGGLLGDYEFGAPEDREFPRASRMFAVDPAVPGGLKAVADEFTSEAAEAFELE